MKYIQATVPVIRFNALFFLILFIYTGCGDAERDGNPLEAPLTDDQAVAADTSALTIGYSPGDSASNVTQDITLAMSGACGTSISWSSSSTSVISDTGTVTRQLQDTQVIMTATITKNLASSTKTFTLTVINGITAADFYVSNDNGDDSGGTGAIGSPYKTIGKAISMCPGTSAKKIYVAKGVYDIGTTAISFNKNNVSLYGGFSADFSTRDCVNRTDPNYQTKITSTCTYGVFYYGSSSPTVDYGTIDGFYIETATTPVIFYLYACKDIVIKNNTVMFTGNPSGDMEIVRAYYTNSGGLTVSDNIFNATATDKSSGGNSFYMIRATSAKDLTFKNNTMLFGTSVGYIRGLYLAFSANNATATVENNTIDLGTFASAASNQPYGISLMNTGYTGCKFHAYRNKITMTHNNTTTVQPYGISFYPMAEAFIYSNVIKFSGTGTCRWMNLIETNNAQNHSNLRIYNNTLYSTITTSSSDAFYAIGLSASAACSSGYVYNNLIHVENSSTGIRGGIFAWGQTLAACQYNYIYINSKTSDTSYSYDSTNYNYSTCNSNPPNLNSSMKIQMSSPSSVKTGGYNWYTTESLLRLDADGTSRPSTTEGTIDWALGAYVYQ